MIENDKKIIVFKKDINDNEITGNLCYVKFLDEEEKYAVFYKPLIAPKYFKHYLAENKIKEAYVLISDHNIEKYKDVIYTFKEEHGVYLCSKGVTEHKKLVLLVDKGMDIELSLPKYFYELNNNRIFIKPYKKIKNKEYCYVCEEKDLNEYLKKIMIEASEVVPGVLYLGEYNIDAKIKKLTE